jgi:uncharacterized membrane protein YfcA
MTLAVVAIFVGAVTQRIAGMGFAMMVAPFVVLALGPSQGVVLVNLCGIAVALITMLQLRRDIDWSAFAWLITSSLAGIAVGIFTVRSLDAALFQVVVGGILILAIAGSVLIARTSAHVSGRRWTAVAGASTGALVAAAGIGGPPMTIYAVLTRWNQRSFAATMQPYQACVSAVAVLAALAGAPESWPALPGASVLVVLAAIGVGLTAGNLLGRVVPPAVGRWVVIALALIGAVITLISGLQALSA